MPLFMSSNETAATRMKQMKNVVAVNRRQTLKQKMRVTERYNEIREKV